MAANRSITVEQKKNHNFKLQNKENDTTNAKLVYQVTKTVNTIAVHIGEQLSPDRLQSLIRDGYTVTVTPESKKK